MLKNKAVIKWIGIGAVLIVIAVVILVVSGGLPFLARAGGAQGTPENAQTVVLERGNLNSVVGATGTVRSNQSAMIAWQTSGKVGDVLVELGQSVNADAVLASLDPNTISQSIIQAQTDLINAQNTLDDLYDPQPLRIAEAESALDEAQTGLDKLLNPSALDIAQAESAVLAAQDRVDDTQQAVDSLANGRGDTELIEAARAAYLLAQDKVEQMQNAYDRIPGSPEEDPRKALALSNLAAAKNERDRALASLNWYLGEPTEAEIAEKNADLVLAQAQLADTQETLATLQNPTTTDIQLAQARIDDAQEALDSLVNGPTEDEISVAQNRVTLAQAALNQASLTAPFSGAITEIRVMTGDMVSQGEIAFRIDDLSELYVDLQVSEIDFTLIQVGQPVSITFDAIPDKGYNGEVTSIGLVGSLDQGAVYFPVTVRLTDPDQEVKSGMTAVANLIIGEVEDVLQVPNRAIQTQNGNRFVNVLRDGVPQMVTVKIGLVSDTMSEVISDELKEGDQILVSVLTASESSGMFPGMGGGFTR